MLDPEMYGSRAIQLVNHSLHSNQLHFISNVRVTVAFAHQPS